MGFRRSDPQEVFFVPGTQASRVYGYGTTDPLEQVLAPHCTRGVEWGAVKRGRGRPPGSRDGKTAPARLPRAHERHVGPKLHRLTDALRSGGPANGTLTGVLTIVG
jgi:hypothetical protein